MLKKAIQDPWDPIKTREKLGRHVLTSVEFTCTNLCNMRCEHCAVGHTLTIHEPPKLPLDTFLQALDQVEHLQTISITGGEPTFSKQTIEEYILPLLKYAKERGLSSQINSNLTLDYSRYECLLPYLDVMHISFNYTTAQDFYDVCFAKKESIMPFDQAKKMYDRMVDNIKALSRAGMFVSAESMINYRTVNKLSEIHRLIVNMGCQRHEVHPMYPSSFAATLPIISLEQMKKAIQKLLVDRNKDVWMLFGTLPYYACNESEEERRFLYDLLQQPNVTVRNDPDGRNRLNVNMFDGKVYVTDFADVDSFGNVQDETLDKIFDKWLFSHPLSQQVNCYCAEANCCGPNLLVKQMYYQGIDFKERKAR